MSSTTVNVLEKLAQMLNEDGHPTVLNKKGEEDYPVDILTAMHTYIGMGDDEVLGEYFFIEPDGEDDVYVFNAIYTLSEELDVAYADNINECIAKLNFYLHAGSFSVDALGQKLFYKLTLLAPAGATEEELTKHAEVGVNNALGVLEQYCQLMLKAGAGEADIKDVLVLFDQNLNS